MLFYGSGILTMLDVGDVWMLEMWDIGDVQCLGNGMLGMCYVRDVEELNGSERDGILNLENISKTVFID